MRSFLAVGMIRPRRPPRPVVATQARVRQAALEQAERRPEARAASEVRAVPPLPAAQQVRWEVPALEVRPVRAAREVKAGRAARVAAQGRAARQDQAARPARAVSEEETAA